MKKAAAIFLLTIFLFNTVGYYVFFKAAQYKIKSEIKKELKSKLNENELTAIQFSSEEIAEIHWIEKGKEFIYNNQMFDIVKKTNKNGITTYYCINDKQEKQLFQHLEEQVLKQIEQNKNSKNTSSKKGADLQTLTYFFETISLTIFKRVTSFKFNSSSKQYASVEKSITTPPPRF